MENTMRVVLKRVGAKPVVRDIPNSLAAMQKEVGGYIEVVSLSKRIKLICNEEGCLLGLPTNFELFGSAIVGNVFFCAVDESGEDFVSLSPGMCDRLVRTFERGFNIEFCGGM